MPECDDSLAALRPRIILIRRGEEKVPGDEDARFWTFLKSGLAGNTKADAIFKRRTATFVGCVVSSAWFIASPVLVLWKFNNEALVTFFVLTGLLMLLVSSLLVRDFKETKRLLIDLYNETADKTISVSFHDDSQ